MKRVVKSSLAFALAFVMLFTSGMIVNATELQPVEKSEAEDGSVVITTTNNPTKYEPTIENKIKENLPEANPEKIQEVEYVEDLNTTDSTIKDSDSFFKSCRLIVESKDSLEFKEDSIFSNNIVSVQHIDNNYIVTYRNVEATEKAYNELTSFGLNVEVDMPSISPEDVEDTDVNSDTVKKKDIAKTNDKLKETKTLKDTNKESGDNLKKTIVVAMLDTGLNNGEEIFDDKIIEGKNFIKDKDDYNDINGHGTTMSRLVLENVSEVNKEDDIKIMPIKVLDDEGNGSTLSAYKGIKYVIEQKEKNPNLDFVINLSMSGLGQSKLLTSAINEAYNNGIPVVVSAGNNNKDIKDFTPANIRSAFTIASAYEEDDEFHKALYSNYGKGIDYVTYDRYEYMRDIDNEEVITKVNGTSVSSAYVTSYIALLKKMATSDDDKNNDDLSITDIDNSLYLSAIDLENTELFGKGYLEKSNLVLSETRIKDKKLPIENLTDSDLLEDIEITADVPYWSDNLTFITERNVYIQNLPPGGAWYVQVYVLWDVDGMGQWGETPWVTATDGYHGINMPEGGQIEIIRESDTQVRIHYDHANLTNATPWIKVGAYDTNRYHIDRIERRHPGDWNSAQNMTDTVYNDWDVDWGTYQQCYAGIGTWEYDEANGRGIFPNMWVYWTYIPQNIHVNYHAHGGTVVFLGQDQNQEVMHDVEYDANGYNDWSKTNLGRGFTAKRDGYMFKGWYFSDRNDSSWENSPKHWLTDYIDYTNTYSDLYNSFAIYDYNMKDIGYHMYHAGADEGRTHSEYKRSYNDYGNPINGVYGENPYDNFDNFRQLLSDGKGICGLDSVYGMFGWANYPLEGQHIVAHAVWEKVPGFEVTWDTNGGEWADGSTKDVTFSYKCNGQNELLPSYYVGIDANASPTKDGKILKGWYFTYDDGSQRKVEQVTDMIDYYNRNPNPADLRREGIGLCYGMINMNGLWRHWHDFGKGEHRQIAERAATLNDIDNKESDYDYGDQLLKPGQFFANTYVEGSYDLKNYKLRAYAIYMDGHKIDYVLNGGTNHPNNPTTYEVNQPISIFPATKENNKFVGWTCNKPVKINGVTYEAYTNLGANFVLDPGDYGDLTFEAFWNEIPIPEIGTGECGDQGLPHPSPSGHNYSVIWDSNTHQYGYGNRSGDFQTGTYMHTWWDPCHHTVKCNCGKYGCSTCCEGGYWYGDMVTFPSPKTPKTPTLHFNDPNAHGNTPDIVSPIKTVKDFVGWNGSIPAGYTARDLTGEGGVIRYNAKWQRRTYQLPSASKDGYDFLGWQIQGDNDVNGRIYRAGETFVIPDKVTRYGTFIFDPCMENDYTFVAVWRRNEGQIRYNANGAVDNNNREYAQVTDDTKTKLTSNYNTKSGNIFGTEYKEDTFVKNETTKNKVGTTITNKYILNKGDITNTLGTKDKLSTFQGWSSVNYARHDTQNILYNGQTVFRNMYYDATASVLLNLTNKPYPYTRQNVINNANKIEAHRKNNIDKYGTTPRNGFIGDWFAPLTSNKAVYDRSLEGHGIVDMYATWDEFPAFIEVDDVTILSSDLEKKNFFETDAQIQQRIETRIMRDMIVTDKEQENLGRLPYGQLAKLTGDDKGKGKIGIEVVDLDLDAMREIGTGMTGGILVTIQATDSAGHITKTQIMLYVNQVTSEEDLTGEMKDNYTRFITKDSYTATYENGGPYSKSKWRLVDAYRNELLTSFDNLDKLVSIDNSSQPIPQNTEVWYFTHDDVEATREFVKANGIGKSKKSSGLADYQNTIKNNKTNKVKTIVNEEPK